MGLFKREKRVADTIAAYQKLFNSDEGKIVLLDLIKSCNVLNTTYSTDSHETAYREGERSVVLRILKTINTDPARVMELMKLGNQEDEKYAE